MTAADVPTAQYAQYSPLPYTQFHVIGTPAPQGSKRHVGKGIMVESSKAVGPWRDSVATQTAELMERYGWPMHVGPLVLTVTFWLRRPPSAPRRRIYPDRYPDLSKLTRATEDALVTAGIIEDDARIVELRVRKRYAVDGHWTGAAIRIDGALTDPQGPAAGEQAKLI